MSRRHTLFSLVPYVLNLAAPALCCIPLLAPSAVRPLLAAQANAELADEQDRLSKRFLAHWNNQNVCDAREVVKRMLILFDQEGVSHDLEDYRTTNAWKHELDVLCELDEQALAQFFTSLRRITEISQLASRTVPDSTVEQEVNRLVAQLPHGLDFRCPSRLVIAQNCAILKCALGDYAGAKPIFVQLKEGQANMSGKKSEWYAGDCEYLGGCALALNELDEAESNFKECYSILANQPSPESHSLLRAQANLAIIDVKRMRYDEAVKKLDVLVQKTKGDDQSILLFASSQYQLGVIRMETMQLESAETAFQTAINSYQKIYPNNHQTIARAVERLGRIYERTGRSEKARALREQFGFEKPSLTER